MKAMTAVKKTVPPIPAYLICSDLGLSARRSVSAPEHIQKNDLSMVMVSKGFNDKNGKHFLDVVPPAIKPIGVLNFHLLSMPILLRNNLIKKRHVPCRNSRFLRNLKQPRNKKNAH